MTPRRFIAHRGVHLGCTAAGENSLEAVELARRAGFACIETDVHLSSDGVFVVMHDETLNRTATHADGRELETPVRVDATPYARLRSDYRLKARDPENRTRIPTLEEYLRACADAGLLPFIEVKLHEQPPEFYRALLELADGVMGRGEYVVTSNGEANRAIRALGVDDVPLMDILYQAPSFDDVRALGDVIVAVSATRYGRTEHLAHVERARAAGLLTEAHADDHATFALADEHGVDLVSTDLLAPDLPPGAPLLLTASLAEGGLACMAGGARLPQPPHVAFGAMFVELALLGSCSIRLGPQTFSVSAPTPRTVRHQVMLFDEPAGFALAAGPDARIDDIRLRVAEY